MLELSCHQALTLSLVVMCWAGLEALSPPGRAHSSPAKARPEQGLQVGSGPA